MYPLLDKITIEHIQGYLFAHQNLVNAKRSSPGSMMVFETFYSNHADDDVNGTFVEVVIRGLKEWRDYDTESRDRDNFEKQFSSERVNDKTEFVKTIDIWFLDQMILGSKSKSSANTLVQLFEELLGNEFEIHRLVIDPYFLDSKDYPWFMAAAWGMTPFDLFILKNSHNKIILQFGEIVT